MTATPAIENLQSWPAAEFSAVWAYVPGLNLTLTQSGYGPPV
jgi:hypothetical protein